MARFVKPALAAVVVAILLLWAIRHESTTVGFNESAPTSTGPGEPELPLAAVGEIDVSSARRTMTLGTCPDSEDDRSVEERLAEYEAQQEQMLRVLEKSQDAEHLLVAALVSWRGDTDSALLLLGEAAAQDPENAMVASQVLELCLEIGHCSRARPEMERNLVAADKANVLAWTLVARSRLSRDDEQGALSALREAAAAAVVEDYFTDYVLTFDRALAASSDLLAHERMAAAFGHSAAVFSTAHLVSADCRERAPVSAEWADACIRVGERLESEGQTILTAAIGIGMQVSMYEVIDDRRGHDRALQRQSEFRERYRPLISRVARAEELEDATVFRKYLEVFDSGGELEAMEYLADEVAARLPASDDAQQPACRTP